MTKFQRAQQVRDTSENIVRDTQVGHSKKEEKKELIIYIYYYILYIEGVPEKKIKIRERNKY